MGAYCINTSGSAVPVYSSNAMTTQIGTIYTYECFAWVGTWAGSDAYYPNAVEEIYFKSGSSVTHGYILNTGTGVTTSFLNYSFGNVTMNIGSSSQTFKTFKTRKALSYYNASGTLIGTCVSGARIATSDTVPGTSKPECMAAMFLETGVGTNVWKLVNGTGDTITYGFIDTGLSSGSLSTAIGVYGNW